MGGGDLNLKKSWHTGLLSNQRKVWEAEQQALGERKKIEQVKRERDEERQMEEIAQLAEESGGTKRLNRVDWMYTGASAGSAGTTEEQESFLLGKRRVDTILKREDAKQMEKAPVVERDPVKDIASKVAMDPLLMIEKQQQEALEKAMQVEANIQKRKRKHDDRDRDSRRHGDHKSSRSHGVRSHGRSQSKDERYRRRREDGSRSKDGENRHRRRERTRSSDGNDKYDRYHRSHSDDRSRSPPRRKRSDERSRSPQRRRHSPSRHDRPRASVPNPRPSFRDDRRERPRQSLPHSSNKQKSEDERQARLAAMQADASNIEEDRARRLEALEKRDAEEREKEEKKRDGGVNFKSSMYQQTESIGLEGRLKNARRTQLSA